MYLELVGIAGKIPTIFCNFNQEFQKHIPSWETPRDYFLNTKIHLA
jgi:hypothetical protein